MPATKAVQANRDYYLERIRRDLEAGRSAKHASAVQRFFKEPVKSLGWRTADLRRLARGYSREIAPDLLLDVAEALFFRGPSNEENTMGVLLLERAVRKFGEREFRRFQRWLPHVTNWSACDGLCMYLIGPLVASDPERAAAVFRWARSRNRWYRRAAAVSLVHCARRAIRFREIFRLCDFLLEDEDDMVRKGVGWLLREAGKKSPGRALPYLMRIKGRAPRLVLRTACEKLTPAQRRIVLQNNPR